MMAMSKAAKVSCADGGHSGATNTCKLNLPSSMLPAIQEADTNSLVLNVSTEAIVDPMASLTLAGNANAILRCDRTLKPPRSTLCIFLI